MSIQPIEENIEISAMWRSLSASDKTPMLDHCLIRGTKLGWSLEGVTLGEVEDAPFKAQYRITLDRLWRTRLANLTIWQGSQQKAIRMGRADDGDWSVFDSKVDLSTMHGLVDIHMAVTPVSALFPIKRLALQSGEKAEIQTVWLHPVLTHIEAQTQNWEYLNETTYRLTRNETSTEIHVNAFGLPTHYEDWKLVALESS